MEENQVLEVDCESEPTLIYELIVQKDWKGVKYQAENFQHEARTWIRKVDRTAGIICWRVLPIHAAIYGGVPGNVLV